MNKLDWLFLLLVSCCFIPACTPETVEVERWNDPVVIVAPDKCADDCKCCVVPVVEEPSVPKPETPEPPPPAVVEPPAVVPVCVDGSCGQSESSPRRGRFRGIFRRR